MTAVPAGGMQQVRVRQREVETRARRDVDETEIPHVAEQLLQLWRNVLRRQKYATLRRLKYATLHRLKYATLPLVCMTHEQCTSTLCSICDKGHVGTCTSHAQR